MHLREIVGVLCPRVDPADYRDHDARDHEQILVTRPCLDEERNAGRSPEGQELENLIGQHHVRSQLGVDVAQFARPLVED